MDPVVFLLGVAFILWIACLVDVIQNGVGPFDD
jgi:hypothetical protein